MKPVLVDPDYFPGDPSPEQARWFLRGCALAIVLLVVVLVVLIAKAAAVGA